MTDLVQILSTWGPSWAPVLLAFAFFLWRDYAREGRLTESISTTLLDLVAKTTAAIERNTAAFEHLDRRLDALNGATKCVSC